MECTKKQIIFILEKKKTFYLIPNHLPTIDQSNWPELISSDIIYIYNIANKLIFFWQEPFLNLFYF